MGMLFWIWVLVQTVAVALKLGGELGVSWIWVFVPTYIACIVALVQGWKKP